MITPSITSQFFNHASLKALTNWSFLSEEPTHFIYIFVICFGRAWMGLDGQTVCRKEKKSKTCTPHI